MNTQTFTFHVHGMHCNACVVLTESGLKDHDSVEDAVANLTTCCVDVVGKFEGRSHSEVAAELTKILAPHGYTLSDIPEQKKVVWSDFTIAIPVALGFVALFVVLQKVGLVNLVTTSTVSYGTAFLLGIIASLSTCMAVVGGLLLSMSATFAKEGDRIKPQVLFHVGRLASFFILGGVIGALGSVFRLGATGTLILGVGIGIVMLILGINLLDIFSWSKKLQPSMPKFIGKRAHSIAKLNHTLTPLLVGIATFFLPCGFTQSMQIYTLSTGSFVTGAFTMFTFALGTLPILTLISFSSFSIKDSAKSGIFFKTAGLIVIMFGLFNLINSMVVSGLMPPVFNF